MPRLPLRARGYNVMLRVVLDTNIIVSAMLLKGGVPALVLGLALDNKIQLCYSQTLMAEYKSVLGRRKFKFRILHYS